MKAVHFLITEELNQQIEEVMSRLGITAKSEFFRMLAVQHIKENKIVLPPAEAKRLLPALPADLTPNEKIIIDALKTGGKTVNELVEETKLPASTVMSVLTLLLLNDRVTQEGLSWKV